MNSARLLLGYAMETRLTPGAQMEPVTIASPWDLWWACYRAAIPAAELAPPACISEGACAACARTAGRLAALDPPGHPGVTRLPECGCLLRWATAMRQGPRMAWPPIRLSLALIKPGAPATRVIGWLRPCFSVLSDTEVVLTAQDARRLYPEAYGAVFVRDRDRYLTSGPSRILALRAANAASCDSGLIKAQIRARLGTDPLRNHLHMPDNPGETLADIAHFGGYPALTELYRRYESGDTARRLAFYRAALGIGEAGADRAAVAS